MIIGTFGQMMGGPGPESLCAATLDNEFGLGADARTLCQTSVQRKPPLLPSSRRPGCGRRRDAETATGATLPDVGVSAWDHVYGGPPAESIIFGQGDSGESEDDPVTTTTPSSLDTCCLGGHDSSPEPGELGHKGADGLYASGTFSKLTGKSNQGQACATERLFVLSNNRLKFHVLCSRLPA
jgi:hypothetical protein